MRAIWNGKVIAESDDIVKVEGNSYFPEKSANSAYFEKSESTSVCPWKGKAHYYNLRVDGKVNADAVWYYPDPSEEAKNIKGRIAFWKGVEVEKE